MADGMDDVGRAGEHINRQLDQVEKAVQQAHTDLTTL